MLVYTESVFLEVIRLYTSFPITPPRTPKHDLKIGGYLIPANTVVQLNIFSVLRGWPTASERIFYIVYLSHFSDPKYWDDPEKFKPERFITDGKIEIPSAFIPFGVGKRRCIGEAIGKTAAFLTFSNLLANFEFAHKGKNIDMKQTGGLTYGPHPYSVVVTKRHID